MSDLTRRELLQLMGATGAAYMNLGLAVPTITVVDDTFTHRQREMVLIFRRARELAGL
ncbi:MAG TPA: hypothetical protein VG817_05115 [Gemmatimonadales bacterium]|nr:hypothetical protein [Gemmatimonadales bacterium]